MDVERRLLEEPGLNPVIQQRCRNASASLRDVLICNRLSQEKGVSMRSAPRIPGSSARPSSRPSKTILSSMWSLLPARSINWAVTPDRRRVSRQFCPLSGAAYGASQRTNTLGRGPSRAISVEDRSIEQRLEKGLQTSPRLCARRISENPS
jgi:hypothetical protein